MSVLKDSKHLKIPLKEIEIATQSFQKCIGKGGYGMVYKGELLVDGKSTTVAVKRLNEQFAQGLKDDDGFLLSAPLLKDYYEKKKLDEIIDPALREQLSIESMNKFSSIAYLCLHDDRKQRPPMNLVKKELEELLKLELPSYALESPSFISSSHESSYGSDVEWQGFDETFQVLGDNATNKLDVGGEDRAMSYDLEKDPIMEINEEEVKEVLNCKTGIWKSQKLVKLVEDHLENNLETLELCVSVMTTLTRVRETRLLILEALHHFDDEDGVEEKMYEKTLNNLKNFLAAGDPFTQDFFRIIDIVYRRQIAFFEKLQRKRGKLYKALDQSQVSTLLKKSKSGVNLHREVIHLMETENFIAVNDLKIIKNSVDMLQMNIESLMNYAKFAIRMEKAVRLAMDQIKKNLDSFLVNIDTIGEHVILCMAHRQRARRVLLQKIIKAQSNH